ncbi:hypothetical protein ACLESO_36395 [Pyxidicoccus sp. 3LG]
MAFDFHRLRSERVYRNSAPVQAMMADLDRLRSLDTEAERNRGMWKDRALATGIAGLGLLILSAVLAGASASSSVVANVGLALGGVLLLGCCVCLFMSARLALLNLEDRRYELALRVLQRLRQDIDPEETVSLELDFRPTSHPSKLTERGSLGEWKTESYVDPFLTFQARLRDGTHLRLGMEQRLQLRNRTRRNPRGKSKTKRKTRSAALVHVQLRVKPERHPSLAQLGRDARKAVKLPPQVALKRLEVTEDRLSMRARMGAGWEAKAHGKHVSLDAPRTVLMMLLSLYQVLNQSTAMRRRSAARVSS